MNDELTKTYKLNYYQANRQKLIEYQRAYYIKNREKIINGKQKKYNAEYRLKNREKINKHCREYYWRVKKHQPPIKKIKHSTIIASNVIKTEKQKTTKQEHKVTKVQQKTIDIENALTDLLVKKELFKAKLAAEQLLSL